jgi:hypothetical protein
MWQVSNITVILVINRYVPTFVPPNKSLKATACRCGFFGTICASDVGFGL